MTTLSLATVLIAVHVLSNVIWIGALLAVSLLVATAGSSAAPAEIGRAARRVYLTLAAPAFLSSFLAGLLVVALSPAAYARLPWFHAKLTFALVVIVFHHVIGARAKRLASGKTEAASGVALMGVAVAIGAACAVFLAVGKALP